MNIGIKSLLIKDINEIENIINIFIKSSLNIRNNIIIEQNYDTCMINLLRDTYMCNLLWRYVGMMTIIDNHSKWYDIDDKFNKYIQKYHRNNEFKNKLIQLHHHYDKHKQTDYCKFLTKIIDCCNMNNKVGKNINDIINMLENRIYNMLNIHPTILIDGKKEELTLSNYYHLIDNNNGDINHQIEQQYNSRCKNVLSDFAKLIIARKTLATTFNFSSYFNFINRGKTDTSESLKGFLSELDGKLDEKLKHETLSVQSTNKHGKLRNCDIVKHVRMNKNDDVFDIEIVMKKIFLIIEKYFNIKFAVAESIKNFVVYNAVNNNKVIGRLFVNIKYDKNKRLNKPVAIRLSDKILINNTNNNDNMNTLSEIALIANYKNDIIYDDIVLIFKEFGNIVTNILYNSRIGLVNYDDEFANYLPSLMEYIMYDNEIIKLIVEKQHIVDQILYVRDNDICYKLKQKCINAKFDHLLHNSEPLLEIIENSLKIKNNADDEIIQTYQNIYKEYMLVVSDMIDINDVSIDPIVIINEINGTQGILYSNLVNEIFAYATYFIIKNDDKQKNEFIKNVLSNGVTNYRELIRNFLNKSSNISCFDIFVKNIIKNTIDIFETEGVNYFEEECNDHEQIY